MIKFYIPFYYLYFTRLKTKLEFASWHIIFIIPQFLISYFYFEGRVENFLQLFIFSQISFHTLYEIGYIENDILTTQNEKKPTLRLDSKRYIYLKNNYRKVIYFRYFIVLFSLCILYLINLTLAYKVNLLLFILILIINRIFFFIHNNLRNKINILSFFIISVTKCIFPLLLFVDTDYIMYPLLITVLAFPVLRTLEICMLKRHNIKIFVRYIHNLDRFRVFYYLMGLCSLIVVWYFSFLSEENFIIGILIFLYFSIYRIIAYFLIKKGLYRRDDKTSSQYPLK